MQKKLKNSIALKQAKTAIIAAVIVGFMFSFAQLIYDLVQEHEGTQKNVQHILKSMRDPATKAAYNLSSDLADKVLNGVFENPQIKEGYLYAIFGSGENELLSQKMRASDNEDLNWLSDLLFDKQQLHEIPLILDDGRTVTGLLQIRLDEGYLTQAFLDRALVIFSAGFFRNIFLTLVLVIAFYNTLTKPISQIAQRISKINVDRPEQSLLQIPKSHEHDELGVLVKGINKSLKLLGSNLERRRLAELQKEESKEMFETLAKTSSDIFWRADRNLRITLISSDQSSLDLDKKVKLNGQDLFALFIKNCPSEQLSIVSMISKNPRDFRDIQIHFDVNSQPVILSFYGSALFDRNGKFEGYLGTAVDITKTYLQNLAIEETQEKLRQSQKMEAVGQLTGGIAHDFNNLLAIIIGNLEMIEELLPDDPKIKKMLATAITSGEKGATLTQQLLSFSRKQALNPEVVDINHIIEDLSTMLTRTLGGEIKIETLLSNDLVDGYVDATQFENAIINLSINARDAMPAGGTLTIKTENFTLSQPQEGIAGTMQAGAYIKVSVSDTGTGMDKLTLQKAMEPFFTTKDVGKGSGMGLAMVFGFIAQSSGNIQLQSTPDEGSCVSMFLPSVSVAQNPEERRGAEPVPAVSKTLLKGSGSK